MLLSATYHTSNILMKCVHWWKTFFFSCIAISAVNRNILFQVHHKQHNIPGLYRSATGCGPFVERQFITGNGHIEVT